MSAKLLNDLQNGVVNVTFTKASTGQVRNMRATLKPDLLDEAMRSKIPPQTDKDTRLTVWDLDKNDWRSFLTKNIVRFG